MLPLLLRRLIIINVILAPGTATTLDVGRSQKRLLKGINPCLVGAEPFQGDDMTEVINSFSHKDALGGFELQSSSLELVEYQLKMFDVLFQGL